MGTQDLNWLIQIGIKHNFNIVDLNINIMEVDLRCLDWTLISSIQINMGKANEFRKYKISRYCLLYIKNIYENRCALISHFSTHCFPLLYIHIIISHNDCIRQWIFFFRSCRVVNQIFYYLYLDKLKKIF